MALERISICGTDGVGKDTARKIAMKHISGDLRILYIGKPSLFIHRGAETEIQPRITRVLDRIHAAADAKRNKSLISAASAMNVMFMWRYQEPYWSRVLRPDMILSIRDGFADPAAYAPFYMEETLGRLDIPGRIAALKKMHGSEFRNMTIFLDVSAAEAVRRIQERFEAEKSASGLSRPAKWIHVHENIDGITQIREEFGKVLEYLGSEHGTEVARVDASLPPQEVGQLVAFQIRKQIGC